MNGKSTMSGADGSGSVDYTTGDVQAAFDGDVLPGTDNMVAVYVPQRAPRTLTVTSGAFTDTFDRCAAKIYRISKAALATQGVRTTPAFSVRRGGQSVVVFGVPLIGATLTVYTTSGRVVAHTPVNASFARKSNAGEMQTVCHLPAMLGAGLYHAVIKGSTATGASVSAHVAVSVKR